MTTLTVHLQIVDAPLCYQQFLLLRNEPCRPIVHEGQPLDLVRFGGNLLELLQAWLESIGNTIVGHHPEISVAVFGKLVEAAV